MRDGRYVKPAKRCYAPSHIASVIVSARPVSVETRKGSECGVFDSAVVCSAEYREAKWSKESTVLLTSGQSLLDYIEGLASERRKLYVFAPIASNALTLSGFWERLTERKARWEPRSPSARKGKLADAPPGSYIISQRVTYGKPDIVHYHVNGKSILWASGHQYFPCGEDDLSRIVLEGSSSDTGVRGKPVAVTRTPRERATLWLRTFQKLCGWWREVGGGPWGVTIGQLAERFWRSRLDPKTVCTHTDEDVRELEERALFGGRASVWFYGDVEAPPGSPPPLEPPPPPSPYPAEPGPVELWDVRSMYPSLLRSERFPVRLLTHKSTFTVKNVEELLRDCAVVASVRLRARHAEYPVRRDDRVSYPVGEFDTVLCGPELATAIRGDEVAHVYSAAVYQFGRPFFRMADELIRAREAARTADAPAWELFVKCLSNSFAGKLAQRNGCWRKLPDRISPVPWGNWTEHNVDTGRTERYRATASLLECYDGSGTNRKLVPVAFAFLTSYGRRMMREVRGGLPHRCVLAQDTDGIWVLSSECANHPLRRGTQTCGPGELRVAQTSTVGRWFDAKHYWTDTGWVLSGFHNHARIADTLAFYDYFQTNPINNYPDAPPVHVWFHRRRSSLECLPADGRIGPSGWLDPPLRRG